MTIIDEARVFLGNIREQGLEHMLVGGMALDTLGTPRATMDIDIQILAEEGPSISQSTFLGAMVQERSRDEVFQQDVVIVHLPTYGVPIEIFLSDHWVTRQALERKKWIDSTVLGRVPVPTPEDFILLKAAYHESPSRSKRKRAADGVDIESVVQKSKEELDLAYLEKNGKALGVWAFIEGVIKESQG